MVKQLDEFSSLIKESDLREFCFEYYIPNAVHPTVPEPGETVLDFPAGKIGVYTRFFEFANQRVPLSVFLCDLLNFYTLHISQLHPLGAAKISNFEINCRLLTIIPTVSLFRAFYHITWSNGWVTFSKRPGPLQCYTKKVDALRNWREYFFWVDRAVFPWDHAFYLQGGLPKDEHPPASSYSEEDAQMINTNRLPINAYPEGFLVHVGLSRNFFFPDNLAPSFLDTQGRGGCSF